MKKAIIYLILIIILFMIPLFVIKDDYYLHVLIMISIWSILAISMDVLLGFTGQTSFAHGTFFGIGAYSSALLSMKLGFNTWFSMLVGALIASFFSFLIGIPSFRARGLYFSIVTLGFCLIGEQIFSNWMSLTRGPIGLSGIPAFNKISIPLFYDLNFSSKSSYYLVGIVLVIICLVISYLLVNSDVGRAFKAIREDELLAMSVGVSITKFKIIAFIYSAFFAGMAGGFYAHYIRFISPPTFGVFESSFQTVVICIIGGLGTLIGPILGAILLTILPEMLRVTIKLRMLIYAIALLVCIIYMPQGIVGRIKNLLRIE